MTPTQKVIKSQLFENTGRSFLDSGSAYGRNYERWGKAGKIDFDAGINPESVSIPIQTFMDTMLTHDGECTKLERKMRKTIAECGIGFDEIELPEGFEWDGSTANTYNWDNALSQVLQYRMFVRKGQDHYDECFIILSTHNGCDVRGGYSDPRIYKVNDWEYFHMGMEVEATDPNHPDGNPVEDSYHIVINSDYDEETKTRYWKPEFAGKEKVEVSFYSCALGY